MATTGMAAARSSGTAAASDASWRWEGRDRNGRPVKGEMRAPGATVVRTTLRRQGITVTRVSKARLGGGRRVSDRDVTMFTRQMATMMRAGVPLIQSFDIVAKGLANPAMARLVQAIRADVETGTALSSAFRRHPLQFDALYCNLIAAGEAAGILDTLLERLASHREKILAIRGKIKSALFYPTAVVVVAAVILTVIMLFVVPAFKSVFEGFGADLPAPTMLVIALSDGFVEWWHVGLGVVVGGIAAFRAALRRSPAMQAGIDRLALRAPIFGAVLRKAAIARWTRTLSTMFAAGVPLVEGLDSVAGAAGNSVYAEATRRIRQEVATGTSLSTAMQASEVFPNLVVQMASIGEESGALDDMLGKAAEIHEREVDEAVASLSSLMEPLIMVVLGVMIGGIVVAMYMPIFKLGQVV